MKTTLSSILLPINHILIHVIDLGIIITRRLIFPFFEYYCLFLFLILSLNCSSLQVMITRDLALQKTKLKFLYTNLLFLQIDL